MEPPDLPPRPRTAAAPFDHALRYFVPSRREPKAAPYLVELDSYSGNGRCICKHFEIRCEKFLKRGFTPEQAVRGVVIDGELCKMKLKENRGVEDALRCEHILTARSQFCDDVIQAITNAQTIHPPAPKRATPASIPPQEERDGPAEF